MILQYRLYGLAFLSGVLLLSACAVRPVVPVTTQPDSIPKDSSVQIVAVGDMMFGGSSQSVMEQQGYDYPFAATSQLIRAADIAIGNLETPLTNAGMPITEKRFLFRNPPEKVAPALKRAGFDIVTLANNHTLDYGAEGLRDTLQVLQETGIQHHGAGMTLAEARKPVIFQLENGQTVGFLGYSNTFPEEFWADKDRPGTAFGHEQHVREDVSKLVERKIDIIIVSFHWGEEKARELRPYQSLLAYAAIDSGADLVIGHHPHVLQAVEHYRGGLILYSLGNYTFGSRTLHARTSAIAAIHFKNGRFQKLEMTPINVNNFEVEFQPQPLTGERAVEVYTELAGMSVLRGTRLDYLNELTVFEPPAMVETEQVSVAD